VGFRFAKKADEKECTAAQLAVAWVLNQPGITGTILGPRNLEQLEDLLPALDITLDDDDMKFFDSLVPPGRYVVNYFNTSGWMK
jgi:aryl-alcohol dehydrogenase-like predicted oxidoreductase